jgi:ornithine carbamoyltransferase
MQRVMESDDIPHQPRKDLLSIASLSDEDIWRLIDLAISLKKRQNKIALQDKILALLFEKPSLRTRVSFEVAMLQLGGCALYLSPAEVGLGNREQIPDVARTLSRYVNGIAARTYSQQTLESMSYYMNIPLINALSDIEHPCQALGDLLTIYEKKGTLKGLKIAFLGDSNNVANSLLLAASAVGADFTIASPPQYKTQDTIWQCAHEFASKSGSIISYTPDPYTAVEGADIVYTDVWISMGQESEAEIRRSGFASYQVDSKLMSSAKKDAFFMHPLPAHHGEEAAEGMIDHPQSIVFDQAENRLHIQKAILLELLGGG